MPRFFFDVSDGRCSPDTEGLYCTDDMGARLEGFRRVAMLTRAIYNGNSALRDWKLNVKDETGATLFCIEAPSGAS